MKIPSGSSNNGVGSNIYHPDFEDDTHSSIKHIIYNKKQNPMKLSQSIWIG